MIDVSDLLAVADAYGDALDLKPVTVSDRVFKDSKKIAALRAGADITLGRFNAAMAWFSANWPNGAKWPKGIERPKVPASEAAE